MGPSKKPSISAWKFQEKTSNEIIIPSEKPLTTDYQDEKEKEKVSISETNRPLQVKINYLEKMSSGQTDASMKTGA